MNDLGLRDDGNLLIFEGFRRQLFMEREIGNG